MHLHVSNFGYAAPCCINSFNLGDVRTQQLMEVWNNEHYRELRRKMLADEYVPSCNTCYSREKGGADSLRQHFNSRFSEYDPRTSDREITPIYFDVRFSNLCNMKCRTCWHGASSFWFNDAKLLKNFAYVGGEQLIKAEGNYSLVEQIEALIPDSIEFYFAGGEPLIMEEHYRVLQKLIDCGRTNVAIRYNTNFTNLGIKNFDVFEYWKHFDTVQLDISIDEVNERADMVRKGCSYIKLKENRRKLAEQAPHVKVNVSVTVSMFNIYTLCHVIDTLVEDRFTDYDKFIFNILEEPPWYNIRILPARDKHIIESRIVRYSENEELPQVLISELNKIISYMHSEDWSKYLRAFRNVTSMLDEIRGESLATVYESEERFVKILG